ncbi:MAG TPA: glycoside hydrolase family 3 C-terminal domain-containing protein [Pseudonocardiaceae bacterium]
MSISKRALVVVALAGSVTLAVSVTGASAAPDPHSYGGSVARAEAIVAKMTLAQKIMEMHGIQDAVHHRYVPGIPSLGIPPLVVTNGPAGVGPGDTKPQAPATALPAPELLAATWDPSQAGAYGRILGTESADLGNSLLEGTDVNVVRVPQNGRAFENYGEDPYLASQLAVANIRGVQSAGVIGEVKHFDAYSQEANRFALNENIDQRTLREIYDPPFKAAIQQGGADAVMCAYPKVNGMFSCENNELLTTDLRNDWGFRGFVTSDFGATHSTAPSINAGMNLEMPTGAYYDTDLTTAVNDGQVSVSTIDTLLVQRFATMIRIGLFDHPRTITPIPAQADGAVSRSIADQGIVLLRNQSSVLPLNPTATQSIAVIGPYAGAASTGGGGSSHVDPLYTVSPMAGITGAVGSQATVTYNDGSDPATAAALAKSSSVAIVMVGDNETEGKDRASLALSGNQDALVEAVAAANPKTIVVLKSGAPVLMPWANSVAGLVEAWYPGEEDGNAVADVLFGRVDPSGKLPLTFPVQASDVPANTQAQYPGVNNTATFSEGVFVGYRHYDQADIAPLFPFGFGLSYTDFAFSGLRVRPSSGGKVGGKVMVSAVVTNTGSRSGAEVAQLYVGDPSSPTVAEPPNQLQGFAKVSLAPGQSRRVTFTLDARAFSYWNTAANNWQVAGGQYRISVGDSSRNLPLTASLWLPGGNR